ncbi:T-complex protein 1 subunit theta, partial [Conglomerata obtusa]
MQALGDGSTFMVNLACAISKHTFALTQRGMKQKKICDVLKNIRKEIKDVKVEILVEKMDNDKSISNVVRGVLKNDILSDLLVKAVSDIISDDKINEIEDRIRIVKMGTGMLEESFVCNGMIFKGEAKTNLKEGMNLRTSIFNCPVEISRTTTKGVLLMETAQDLINFSKNEEAGIEETVESLIQNSKLVICNGKVEDLFIDYFNMKDAIIFSIYSKHDIRRIRNLLGGSISPVLREVKENGECLGMSVFEEGNTKYTKFEGNGSVITIVVKNSIDVLLDEYERILQKGINVIMNHFDKEIKLTKGSGIFERFISEEFINKSLTYNDSTSLVYKAVSNALIEICVKKEVENIYDVYDIKIKAIQYAIDICTVLLETEDYFYVRENMNIQARQKS